MRGCFWKPRKQMIFTGHPARLSPFSRLKIMRLKPVQPPNERNGHTLLLLIQKILMLKSHALPFSIKILPGKPDEL
jgi:hypothetical protein